MTSGTGPGGPDASEEPLSEWTDSGAQASPTTSAHAAGFTPGAMFATLEVPLPLELRSWYALSGLPVAGFCLALTAYGFYASLGGKSPFGQALLED